MRRLCPHCGRTFEPTTRKQPCCGRKRCIAAHAAANRDRIAKHKVAYYAANQKRIAKHQAGYYAAKRNRLKEETIRKGGRKVTS